jgi:hypothetical protein
VLTADASGLTKVEDKAPAGQVEAGRKVFVVMQNDGSDAAAVVIGAEGSHHEIRAMNTAVARAR